MYNITNYSPKLFMSYCLCQQNIHFLLVSTFDPRMRELITQARLLMFLCNPQVLLIVKAFNFGTIDPLTYD